MKVVRHYCVKLCRLGHVWLDGFAAGLHLPTLPAMPVVAAAPKLATPNLLCQTDNSGAQDPNSSSAVNQGTLLYKAHKSRFNYTFIDGHVEALKIEATIGTGTIYVPNGIWAAASAY